MRRTSSLMGSNHEEDLVIAQSCEYQSNFLRSSEELCIDWRLITVDLNSCDTTVSELYL